MYSQIQVKLTWIKPLLRPRFSPPVHREASGDEAGGKDRPGSGRVVLLPFSRQIQGIDDRRLMTHVSLPLFGPHLTFLFVHVCVQLQWICEKGLTVGHSRITTLGNPSMGKSSPPSHAIDLFYGRRTYCSSKQPQTYLPYFSCDVFIIYLFFSLQVFISPNTLIYYKSTPSKPAQLET